MEELKCPICGEPTSVYMGNARKDRLCRKHAQMLKNGELAQCENCGEWYVIADGCKCKKESIEKQTDELTCLICKEPSNGKHFCKDCWKKYFSTYGKDENKTKKITVVIDNNLKCEVIDEYGNKNTLCSSGAFVRSDCEARIADKLYEHKICVAYEKVVPYDDEKTGKRELLHPDFYLPEENLYIEYNGLSGKEYLKRKEFTEKIYKSKGLNVLTMSHDDLRDLEGFLAKNLKTWK